VDTARARALLAAERSELEQALDRRRHQDDGDEAGWLEPGNLAADLYIDELDEGLADDLRDRLNALDVRSSAWPPARMGFPSKVASRFPTSASRHFRQPSGRWRKNAR
jgi:hypothetical protein